MSAPRNDQALDTRAVHGGEPQPRPEGAVAMPIYQSATFETVPGRGYHDLRYIRLSNTPSHEAVQAKLAALEEGEAALVAASGMAAITTTLLALLRAGDHVLVQDCLYGGTHSFVTEDLGGFGIAHDFIDPQDPDDWERRRRPETKAIYVEAMTNPLLAVADHEAVIAFARRHGILAVIDSTFASPVNFRAPALGFDLSLHSATKYLNGHSDVVAGAIVGRAELVRRVKLRLDHLGGALDPHACFLLHRGLKTLGLRVRRQNENALALATLLAAHPKVKRVEYPGLPSHPQHARAARLFDGCGGVFSFEPEGGAAVADAIIARLRLPIAAPSLGGVESLITRPAITSHAGMSAADRARVGITDGLVRVAIGIEATADLVADFEQALAGR